MSEPETEITLLERLLKTGHGVWWRIENLQSGRSGDVMGEVSSLTCQHPKVLRSLEFSSSHSDPI